MIQSLFMRVDNQPPPPQEIAAYCERLSEITAGGGQIKLVQVYTIARRPAEAFVSALTPEELTSIARDDPSSEPDSRWPALAQRGETQRT